MIFTEELYKVMKWNTNEGCVHEFIETAETICKEHRTEQSNIVRNLRSLLEQIEEEMERKGTDLRNEGAKEWLKESVNLEKGIPYI